MSAGFEAETPAATFWAAVSAGDLDAALAAVDDAATVTIPPAGVVDGGKADAREFFGSALAAFPDLLLTVTNRFVNDEGMEVAELKFEGTQAADFLGIVNQEKHVDVDQVWLLGSRDGRITSLYGMWDRNQLYRRLGVKRLDTVSIV